MSAAIDNGLSPTYNCTMQHLEKANNQSDSQRLYAEQAAQFSEDLRNLLAEIIPQPPDELLQIMTQVAGAQAKDNAALIPNPGIFHRVGSMLYTKPSLTMGELSRTLSVPFYTATRMVDSLVATGLLERLSDPDDRRIVRVALTDDGIRMYEAIDADVKQNIERILARLIPEEQNTLIALLHKIATSSSQP